MKAKGALCALLIVVVTHFPTHVKAEMSANKLLDDHKNANADLRLLLEFQVQAYASGMGWMNAYLKHEGQKQVYCQPAKLALDGSQILVMIRKGVEADSKLGEAPFGLAILQIFIAAFPC
jgi:hypothetical protein